MSSHSPRHTLLAACAAVALAVSAAPAGAEPSAAPAPLFTPESGTVLQDRYIVMLKAGEVSRGAEQRSPQATAKAQDRLERVTEGVLDRLDRLGVRADDVYEASGGFSAELTPAQVAQVRRDPAVAYVEQDATAPASTVQSNAPWGLDRVDQSAPPLNGTYSYTNTGRGVRVYMVDSGLRADHVEFTGRVQSGYSAVKDGRGTDDCVGHGTHTASLAAGTTYGVAKQATVIPVRVLDCNNWGAYSTLIEGVDWAAQNAQLPAVANISITSASSSSFDAAVQGLVNRGVTVSVAAGNNSGNACNHSPARLPAAITVGNTDRTDTRRATSNYGSCVDVFAPGTLVTGATKGSSTATTTNSGTSLSAPAVAGAAALYLQGRPTATPSQVEQAVIATATTGRVLNAGAGSPNRLLNVAGLQPAPAGTTTSPTPAPTTTVPAPTPTPTPAPTPTTVSTGLVNGDFEDGTTGWSGSTSAIVTDPAYAYSGSRLLTLGGFGRSAQQSVYQSFVVPSTATTLDVPVNVMTNDGIWAPKDSLRLDVVGADGVARTAGTWYNATVTNGYRVRSVDVSAHRGKRITVVFTMDEDASGATWFDVDGLRLR